MNFPRYPQSIIERIRQLVAVVRDLSPLARSALRKPAAVGYILLTARRAQITLGISLALLIFLAPAVVESLTGFILPSDTSKKIFGLIKTQQANPLKGVADVLIMTILWVISIGSVLLLFWRHIPEGLARANARAGKLAERADNSPVQSRRRRLFKLALSITTDTGLESEIESSLQAGTILDHPQSPAVEEYAETSINFKSARDVYPEDSQPVLRKQASRTMTIGPQGRYTLGPELGKGAMGVVYRAWDNVLDRKIAIKQLALIFSAEEEYVSRFRREAKALARLTHANVVQVYDLIEDGDHLWMALEYIDGGNLASYLKDRGSLSVGEAVNIVIPVADGLAYAHSQGIVHRDLKPANILLTKEQIPKISDFGIAKMSQSSQLTQAGSVLGSPRYMSPEQCSGGSVDTRTDIYALGVTLYELLTGKVPFEGDTSSVMARHIVEQPAPLSEVIEDIPAGINDLTLRMLAKSPEDRPADMMSIVTRLSPFKDELVSSTRSQIGQNTM